MNGIMTNSQLSPPGGVLPDQKTYKHLRLDSICHFKYNSCNLDTGK